MDAEVRVVDRAGVGDVRCVLEGGKARIELGKNMNARYAETGYGRLFFRYGEGLSASIKHLTVDGKTLADAGHLNTALTLRESVALVRYFNGVLCAPAAKIDIPRGRDVWLMLLAPINNSPRIDVSRPLLVAEKASLSAVDGELRYSLSVYGSHFRRASLELARHVYTGWSTNFGREKITASEKLAEAWPGENIQSVWKPVKRHTEPTIIAMNSIPSRNDIVTLLQSIGCLIHNVLLLVP
jgi:hypothetical protein